MGNIDVLVVTETKIDETFSADGFMIDRVFKTL